MPRILAGLAGFGLGLSVFLVQLGTDNGRACPDSGVCAIGQDKEGTHNERHRIRGVRVAA